MSPRLLLSLLPILSASCATSPAGESEQSAARINAIVDDWNRAWQIEDPVLAASGYSAEAQFTNAFGFHCIGRESIEALLREVFAMPFVMAGESGEVFREIEFLRPDVALVRSKIERGGQRTAEDQDLGLRHTSHLRVFARENGEWRIVSHLISDARSTERPRH